MKEITIWTSVLFNLDVKILTGIVYFLIVWLLGISFFLYKSIAHYNRLAGKGKKKNLQQVLEKILKEAKASTEEIKKLEKRIAQLEEEGVFHIQKIGLLKFNPFKDIGGKQSFAVALLDKKDNGLVLSSLHSRETTRFYVKKVKKGQGIDYQLSKEEKEAIEKAGKI